MSNTSKESSSSHAVFSREATDDLRRSLAEPKRRFLVAMEQSASFGGPNFFAAAAQLLSVLLDARFVFVAECFDSERNMARTLAFWGDSEPAENLDFCAAGGPCERVLRGEVVHIREEVCARFPFNEALQSLSPESYLGYPLVNSRGDVVGHIAAMDVRPMDPSSEDVVILKILASRAAAELERRQIESSRTAGLIRRAEERFRLAQEAADIGTWEMDVTTGLGTWSDNYWGIYGLARDACIPGYEAWIELVHPEDREAVELQIKAALEGVALYRSEFRIVWPDGSIRWLVGKASVFRDGDGKPVRMIGVDYDVTDRKETEQALRQLHDELEKRVADRTSELSCANRRLEHEIAERERAEAERRSLERQMLQAQKLESLGILTSGVAHDFNNLLVTIMGNLEVALRHLPGDSDVRSHVKRAVEGAERASELTQQLLSYSGEAGVTPTLFDLSRLVAEMADLLDVTTSSNVALELSLCTKQISVRADATRIRQIVMNLITNAVEAMPTGGVVQVRTEIVNTGDGVIGSLYRSDVLEAKAYAAFAVADGGPGLSRESCSKIFDPFYTTKFLGRGLGLAAVLGIVRSHRGVIAVDGSLGSGATFTTLLPLATEEAIVRDQPQCSSDWRAYGKALVVDDERAVCETAAFMLESLGFKAILAFSGSEAVGIFERLRAEIRVVLLDHAMPGMNGIETLCRMKEICPDIAVIITSGYGEPEISTLSDATGRTRFLRKPYRMSHLRETLRAALVTEME